ncbi:MAG: DNA polymerase III subunit gamma/tau [Muribaculaceae bacterium]|nr:DNA polymerase III subunit gamma/tau [Muribaculaceae bacterium]
MSDYIVSARKYRPSTFRSVVGQKTLTTTLKNAIDGKRLAQAYLFCGPRGVGKTSCARIFAKTINCLNPTADGEACGECESCKAIDRGNSFNIIELDAASNNSVDDIRALTDEVNVPPQVGDYRVFIIDEVHMLSSAAFNAFLKTLEEPPKYVIFILATTEKHKVIPTILSRCQIYDFKRITTADMVDHLAYVAKEEGIEVTTDALDVIARKADGAMRDALSIFDQVAASSFGHITYQSALANLNVLDYDYYFRLVDAFRNGDAGEALLIFNEIRDKGFDTLFFVNGLASHLRDLMVAADEKTATLLEVADEVREKYTAQARTLPLQWYFTALRLINDCDLAYRTATNKQLLVELTLIRLSQLLQPAAPPFDRVDSLPSLEMPGEVKKNDSRQVTPKPVDDAPAPKPEKPAAKEKPAALPKSEAPAASSQPEPVVTKAEAAPAEVKKKKTGGRKSVRLSDMEEEFAKDSADKKENREEITPEKFYNAWAEFIRLNPDKLLLVEAMKEYKPEKTGDEEYSVKVAHPAQKQAYDTNLNKLITFLRESLKNDFLTLKIEIADLSDIKKPLPPKELFQDMLKGNASIGTIAKTLDVEIV